MIAFVVTELAALAALQMYTDYWNVGRDVSKSPIEIAKAFEAPTLEGVDLDAETKGLVGGVRTRELRYGVVEGADEDTFANDDSQLAPGSGVLDQRLELEKPGMVRKPKAGDRFVG
ncbi:MAG: hypothetical protein M1831_007158 [Alyxoria varia]|nr:MAG: hypothetical protein M1831_007158 [Alyxoria varia]